jgi:hypothetical protein
MRYSSMLVPQPSADLTSQAIEAVEFSQSYSTNGKNAKYGWMRPPRK